jgi:hypothetical protein
MLLCCFACTVPDSSFNSPDGSADGGPEREFDECDDAGPECTPGQNAEARCAELIAATCEPTCQDSAACAAANLTATYEAFRCEEALTDAQTYPHCGATTCENLVEKVCAGNPPSAACADNPGCEPALELHARSVDPEATTEEIQDALGACAQALEDDAIFAPCS